MLIKKQQEQRHATPFPLMSMYPSNHERNLTYPKVYFIVLLILYIYIYNRECPG
jgi:hypothetical protein